MTETPRNDTPLRNTHPLDPATTPPIVPSPPLTDLLEAMTAPAPPQRE